MTQPSEQAMEAARKLLYGTDSRGEPLQCVREPPCHECIRTAAALEAFAKERIEDATDGDRTFARLAQVERERDAALARAEAAEADWRMEKGIREETVKLVRAAEERVRVLEAALREILERAGREGRAGQVARATLANMEGRKGDPRGSTPESARAINGDGSPSAKAAAPMEGDADGRANS